MMECWQTRFHFQLGHCCNNNQTQLVHMWLECLHAKKKKFIKKRKESTRRSFQSSVGAFCVVLSIPIFVTRTFNFSSRSKRRNETFKSFDGDDLIANGCMKELRTTNDISSRAFLGFKNYISRLYKY